MKMFVLFISAAFCLSGCLLQETSTFAGEEATPIIVHIESTVEPAQANAGRTNAFVTPISSATPFPAGLVDALPVMSGICFEAANDAAGQVFVLRNAEDHIHFYDLADNARLCRRPVTRYPFDFSSGAVLAGLWSRGQGCVARHDILSVERDDSKRQISIRLQFITEGDCNYELVRPFWVGIPDAQAYDIHIEVVP